MKHSISLLFILCVASHANATFRIIPAEPTSDWVKHNGQYYRVLIDHAAVLLGYSSPMDEYFDKHPDKHPDGFSWALMRSFVANFEVRGNALYVTDIQILEDGRFNSVMYSASPKSSLWAYIWPVAFKADWYSGVLVLGRTSQRMLMEIDKGTVVKTVEMNEATFESFSKSLFDNFKGSSKYRRLRDAAIDGMYQRMRDEAVTGMASSTHRRLRDTSDANSAEQLRTLDHVLNAWMMGNLEEIPQSELKKLGLKFQSMAPANTSASGCQTNDTTLPLLPLFLLGFCALARAGRKRRDRSQIR